MRFQDCIRSLHFYFKVVKLPSDETMDIWASEIGNYPQEFYSWLMDTMKSRENDLPKNLPRAIKELWQEWLRRNPKKLERQEFKCRQPECKDGFLFVAKETYSYVFRCAECNSREDYPVIPKSTLHALELDGYRISKPKDERDRAFYDPSQWKRSVLPRVGQIIEEGMPF